MNDTTEVQGNAAVATADAHAHVTPPEHGEASHPGAGQYVLIALILGAITTVEVVIYYFDLNRATLITSLFVLSAAKFVLVAAFFMHLKFDSRLFTILFAGGLVMALAAFIAVLFMLRAF